MQKQLAACLMKLVIVGSDSAAGAQEPSPLETTAPAAALPFPASSLP